MLLHSNVDLEAAYTVTALAGIALENTERAVLVRKFYVTHYRYSHPVAKVSQIHDPEILLHITSDTHILYLAKSFHTYDITM